METVERHVTLPTDLDEAWELLTDPADLAGWLGREVVLEPVPGATGSVVEHDGTRRHLIVDEVEAGRRLAWRWWVEGDDETSRVEITLAPAEQGTAVRVVETLAAGTTGRVRRAGVGRCLRGLVAPAPPPRSAPPGGRRRPGVTSPADAEARAAAVFEALADPTRRAVLRDVAQLGPRTATELAADLPVSRQADRQAPGGAARRRPRDVGSNRPRDAVHRPAGSARRGRPVARPHRPGLGGAPEPPRGASAREGHRQLSAGRPPAACARQRGPEGPAVG